MVKNTAAGIFKKCTKILIKNEKIKAIYVLILIIFNGLIEVLGLALVLPVLYALQDPARISENKYFNLIYNRTSLANSEEEFIFLMIIGLPIVFLIKNATSTYIIYTQNKFVNNLAVSLTQRQYKKTLKKDYKYFNDTNSNFILRDISTIPTDFTSGFLLPAISFITEIIVSSFIIICIAIYDIKVFFILLIAILPATALFYTLNKKKIAVMGEEINDIRAKTYQTMFEAIFGIDEVKISNSESFFTKRSLAPLKYLHDIYIKLNVLKAVPNKVIETIAVFSISIIYLSLTYLQYESSSIISVLIVFATAAYRIMPSISRILMSLIDIRNKSYVFEPLLNPQERPREEKIELQKKLPFKKDITFVNINHYYTNKNILKEFNLKIKKGDRIGLIGESGCGKSTFLKILSGLIIARSGHYKIDNVKIDNINVKALRDIVGFVKQDFYLLDATLAENIAFGSKLHDIDHKRLAETIEVSQLGSLVKELKDGANTFIGEFGSNLSGGQRQRIAIARALYKKAEILIFDEATSALDDDTENEIIETINNLDKSLTIIMVAHRKTSLKLCNKVFKMKNGKIYNNHLH